MTSSGTDLGTPTSTGDETPSGTALEGVRAKVFLDRYSLKDQQGQSIETTPEQMWRRVARGIAAIEPTDAARAHWEERFYEAMRDFKFVPGGRILAGAGSGHAVTFYNCFHGDTLVHTREGLLAIGSLRGEHEVLSEGGVYRPAFFRSYGYQRLWAVTLSNGTTLLATGDHQWVVAKPKGGRERVLTRELRGRRIPINPRPAPVRDHDFAEGVRHGIVFGDGSMQYGQAHLCLFGESEQLAVWFADYGTRQAGGTVATKAHLRVQGLPATWKQVPMPDASPAYWRGFVAGLIAADGHVDARGSVALYNKDAAILTRIAEGMAIAGLVSSGITLVREISPFDGTAKPLYRLQLFKATVSPDDLLLASHRANFEASPRAREATIRVLDVRETDRVEEVFCCVEPETHTITVGHGYLTGQCYVIPSPEDSRGGILDNLKVMTEIMARGGGVGINLSTLRPRGSYIKTVNGTASGPCSWAELYSVATGDVIQQGGSRRGALMLMLDDDHPDIEEFITAKRIDPLTNRPVAIEHANVSVAVSNAFMEAVKADAEWQLQFPTRAQVRMYPELASSVTLGRKARARAVWDLICQSAWATAEPGVVFMDRYNERSNTWYYENIRCVNPCVTGDTLVSTEIGYIPARQLEPGMRIRTPKGLKPIEKVYNNGKQRIYRVTFSDGGSLDCTADHKLKVIRGKKYEWITTADLQQGDKVLVMPNEAFGQRQELPKEARDYIVQRDLNLAPYYDRTLGLIVGAVLGDGALRRLPNRNSFANQCRVAFGTNEDAWLQRFTTLMEQLNIHTHLTVNAKQLVLSSGATVTHSATTLECYKLATLLIKIGMEPNVKSPAKVIAENFLTLDKEFLAGVLDGLFSTDGSVLVKQDNPLLRFHTSSCELARQVRLLLLRFGIHARIYRAARAEDLEYDGRRMYGTGEKYDVVVMNEGIARFYAEIGLSNPDKAARLKEVAENWHFLGGTWTASVVSVEDTGREEDVFDVYEPETLTWVTNGYVSFDCGEQGLPEWGVCNLGALNVAAFVHGPLGQGTLDWDALAEQAKVAMRFLDNVIDANLYFIEENRRAQLGTRRTGLGTMGLADAFIKMGVAYGSEESLAVGERIYRTIRDAAYEMSADIAAEKGAFPFFDRDKYLQGQFIQELPAVIQTKIAEQGIRNAVLLTQAPTGTTSLLAGVSSGIEPVFSFAMKRVDRTGEHLMYHPLLQAWKDAHPGEPTPDYFVATPDLTPEEHVRVQAMVQRYTDSSISKTVNAPNNHTVDEVKRLYLAAYEQGCKGVTYYRDGSRDAVLTHLEEKKEETAQAPPVQTPTLTPVIRPRPAVLHGYTRNIKAPEGTVNITVNSDEEGPLEVFVNVGRAGSDVAALAEALGRLISLTLRIPSPISQDERLREVVSQLRGIGGSRSVGFGPEQVRSLPDAVGKALGEHLDGHPTLQPNPLQLPLTPREEPATTSRGNSNGTGSASHEPGDPLANGYKMTGNLCPECGSSTLVYQEGCKKCFSCGHSEC